MANRLSPVDRRDQRASEIGRYLAGGHASRDAVRVIAYLLEAAEQAGDLEYFISEEIDAST